MRYVQVSKTCWPYIEGAFVGEATKLGNMRITGNGWGGCDLPSSVFSRNNSGSTTVSASDDHGNGTNGMSNGS